MQRPHYLLLLELSAHVTKLVASGGTLCCGVNGDPRVAVVSAVSLAVYTGTYGTTPTRQYAEAPLSVVVGAVCTCDEASCKRRDSMLWGKWRSSGCSGVSGEWGSLYWYLR